jgi:hypothetical protein
VKQLLLFALETVVLAWLVQLVAGNEEAPDVIQVGARVLSRAILLVGFIVLLGWVRGRRSLHPSR